MDVVAHREDRAESMAVVIAATAGNIRKFAAMSLQRRVSAHMKMCTATRTSYLMP